MHIRGPIWININYLALDALRHYGTVTGPYKERSREIYGRLRYNIQRTILSNLNRTGYLWEQYDDTNGLGIRGHPFSGWTALIVNIMSELY